MKQRQRALALIGTIALASSLVACSNGPTEVNADDTEEQSQASDGTSISSINEDNVEGMCEQVFGNIEDVYDKLQLDVPADAQFGYTDDKYVENGGWGDEYFPEEDSKPATFRCQAKAFYEDDSGSSVEMNFDISVAAGDDDPLGNADITVSADGLTAGLLSFSRSGSGMSGKTHESETVEKSAGEQFITDEVLPKFTP